MRSLVSLAGDAELSAVAGADECLVRLLELEQTSHVRTDARQRSDFTVPVDEESLDMTRSERLDGAVRQVRDRRHRYPAPIGANQRRPCGGRPALRRETIDAHARQDTRSERAEPAQKGSTARDPGGRGKQARVQRFDKLTVGICRPAAP